MTKKEGAKTVVQPTVSAPAAVRDAELEDLEQRCYAALVDCCKELAKSTNVNYTTIMNLQVRHFYCC